MHQYTVQALLTATAQFPSFNSHTSVVTIHTSIKATRSVTERCQHIFMCLLGLLYNTEIVETERRLEKGMKVKVKGDREWLFIIQRGDQSVYRCVTKFSPNSGRILLLQVSSIAARIKMCTIGIFSVFLSVKTTA